MSEFFMEFEQSASRFNDFVLIFGGIVSALCGLFVWLGGIGLRRTVSAVSGAIFGGVCGFFVSGRNLVFSAIGATLGAITAALVEKVFIVILAAALGAGVSFIYLAGPYFGDKSGSETISADSGNRLNPAETAKAMGSFAGEFARGIKAGSTQMPPDRYAIIAACGLTLAVCGAFLRRATWAFCLSLLGTALVFSGMILLLLHKGSMPISCIAEKGSFYAAVFAVMTAFGTVEQLFFCPWMTKKPGPKERHKQEK